MQAAVTLPCAPRRCALWGETGDVSTFPLLLAAASDSEAEIVAAAEQAMVALQGDDIDVAVEAALADAEGSPSPLPD